MVSKFLVTQGQLKTGPSDEKELKSKRCLLDFLAAPGRSKIHLTSVFGYVSQKNTMTLSERK